MRLFRFVCAFLLFLLLVACPQSVSGQSNPLLQKQIKTEELVNQFQLADRQAQRTFGRARQKLGWKAVLLIFGIRPRLNGGRCAEAWTSFDKWEAKQHTLWMAGVIALEEARSLGEKLKGNEKRDFDSWQKEMGQKLFTPPKDNILAKMRLDARKNFLKCFGPTLKPTATPSRSPRAGFFFSFA